MLSVLDRITLELHTPGGKDHDQSLHGNRVGSKNIKLLKKEIQNEFDLEQFWLSETEKSIELSNIRVKALDRGKGVGSKVVRRLQEFARSVDKPIIMGIEADPGKKDDLEKFYKKLGFKRPGSSKDYELRQHSHIWYP